MPTLAVEEEGARLARPARGLVTPGLTVGTGARALGGGEVTERGLAVVRVVVDDLRGSTRDVVVEGRTAVVVAREALALGTGGLTDGLGRAVEVVLPAAR